MTFNETDSGWFLWFTIAFLTFLCGSLFMSSSDSEWYKRARKYRMYPSPGMYSIIWIIVYSIKAAGMQLAWSDMNKAEEGGKYYAWVLIWAFGLISFIGNAFWPYFMVTGRMKTTLSICAFLFITSSMSMIFSYIVGNYVAAGLLTLEPAWLFYVVIVNYNFMGLRVPKKSKSHALKNKNAKKQERAELSSSSDNSGASSSEDSNSDLD